MIWLHWPCTEYDTIFATGVACTDRSKFVYTCSAECYRSEGNFVKGT